MRGVEVGVTVKGVEAGYSLFLSVVVEMVATVEGAVKR